MSIEELLKKVNSPQTSTKEVTLVQEQPIPNNTLFDLNTFKVEDINAITFDKLLELSKQVESWLRSHECQTGTANKLDINDRPYEPDKYEKNLKLYEKLQLEIFNRPLEECFTLKR